MQTNPSNTSVPNSNAAVQPDLAQVPGPDIWVNWRGVQDAADATHGLETAQRALERQPSDPRIQANVVRLLLRILARDPFLAFVAQTENNYVVAFRRSRPILVPKSRGESEIFPPARFSECDRVLGLVGWMALGLVPAGFGAVVLFPFVFVRSAKILVTPGISARDSRRALMALVLACLLVGLGALLMLILILHVVD